MAETAHEPTMEEILASIRRIISEDEVPAEEAKQAEPEPEPEPEPIMVAPEPVPEPVFVAPEPEVEDEDVLELTTPIVAPKSHVSIGDIDAYEPAAVIAPIIAPRPIPTPDYAQTAGLVSERTMASAISSFGQLTSASLLPSQGRTIEDLLTEILRPMLQNWLDANLPAIVETSVREEVERLARQSRR
jgi:uncharacterized protein